MKKIGKILLILLCILILGVLIIDMVRVAGCRKPFLKTKTSCEYENNHSIYRESGLLYEYIEDSSDDGIGGILTKVFGHKVCDIHAGNLRSCKVKLNNSENEKYVINSNCPKIVENIQILEEGDLGWFDTQGKGIPIGFGGAAFYYLPYDIENFDEYYSLIKGNPGDKYHIWKITVSDKYMDGLPALAILKVEKPTKVEEERTRKWLDEQPENICETTAKREVEEMHSDNMFISIEWNTWEDSDGKVTGKGTLNFSNSGKSGKIDFECSVTEDGSRTATYGEIHFDEFLEDIKSSGEQPQGKNIFIPTEDEMDISNIINLKIGDKTFDVSLEENSATKALIEKLQEGTIIVNAHDYGGFEKVGNLGFDLPREDKQITTEPGDLVLYQGNQISLFYNSNSWSYTKLGKLGMISKDGLKEILGDGDVNLIFSI